MSYSNLLCGPFSFWEGFGHILDVGGSLVEFNTTQTASQADRAAIRSDWNAVGIDLWAALQEARRTLPGVTGGPTKTNAEEA